MLVYVNKVDNFFTETHFQNIKQTKIDTFIIKN